ncbi:SpoIID/LytB domain-containing protein [bacterium]|nr:SpoIID/LytB domain-containing protein [bacterium]MBT6293431.1 SpoIID/LytB domain-containing protein [bacterium]
MKKLIFIFALLIFNLSYADLMDLKIISSDLEIGEDMSFDIKSSGMVIKSKHSDLHDLDITVVNENNYREHLHLEKDHDTPSLDEYEYFLVNTFDTKKIIINKSSDLDFEISFFEKSNSSKNNNLVSFLGKNFKEDDVIKRSSWLKNSTPYRSSSKLGNLNNLSYVSKWNTKDVSAIDFKENGKWYTWPVNYLENVDSIIIHHTASTKLLNKPKQALNNIYTYHTKVRGWGDIGYHYLMDQNGNVYEGKFGGDVVVGGHSKTLNKHAIGIAVMGNFEENKPKLSLINSLSDLIALKAHKFNLDPNGKFTVKGKTYDVIQGHKDNDHTLCPGKYLYEKIPNIKQKISSRLGKLDNEYTKNISSLDINKKGSILNLEVGKNYIKTYEIIHNNPKKDLAKPKIKNLKNLKSSISSFRKKSKNKYELKVKLRALKDLQNQSLVLSFNKDLNLQLPVNAFASKAEVKFSKESLNCKTKKCNLELELTNTSKKTITDLELAIMDYNSKNNFPDFKVSPSRFVLKKNQKKKIKIEVNNSKKYKGNVFLNVFNEQGALNNKGLQIKFPKTRTVTSKVKSKNFDIKKGKSSYISVKLDFPISSLKRPTFKVDQKDVLLRKARIVKIGKNYNVFFRVKYNNLQKSTLNYELKSGSKIVYKGDINFNEKSKVKKTTKVNKTPTKTSNIGKLKKDDISILLSKVNMSNLEFKTSKNVDLKINSRIQKLKANQIVKVRALNKGMIITINGKRSPANRLEIIGSDENITTLLNYENRPAFNLSLNDNQFRGGMKISANKQKLEVVNKLGLESYLKGLAEISDFEHPEKIKTIVVAARSYAYHYITDGTKFAGKKYNLDDDPNVSQKYLGYGFEKRAPNVIKEVLNTQGQMVTYNNKVIKVPYFSQSNGYTKSAKEVWGWNNTPYLQSVKDDCPKTEFKGHGVGISGCGSKNMALKNYKFQEIIKYYLPGTNIKTFK